MQNHTPTSLNRAVWKRGLELHYGDRLLLGRVSSNISAVDWDIWSTFGTLCTFRNMT